MNLVSDFYYQVCKYLQLLQNLSKRVNTWKVNLKQRCEDIPDISYQTCHTHHHLPNLMAKLLMSDANSMSVMKQTALVCTYYLSETPSYFPITRIVL